MKTMKGVQVTIRLRSPEEMARLEALEEALYEEGVCFDTGSDLEEGLRDWELDESLEGPMTPRAIIARLRKEGFRFTVHRKKSPRRRRLGYKVGDVFRVRLGPKQFAYGRVLIKRPPMILVEFYRTLGERDSPLDTVQQEDSLLRIYTLDSAIAEDGRWKTVGHVPIEGEVARPFLWIEDPFTRRLYLTDDPVHQGDRRPTTREEIRRLGAQPSRVYGNFNAEKELRRALQKARLL